MPKIGKHNLENFRKSFREQLYSLSKEDFETLFKSVTNVENPDDIIYALFYEYIPISGLINDDGTLKMKINLSELFNAEKDLGILREERLREKYNFKVYWNSKNKDGYKNIENISKNIEEILNELNDDEKIFIKSLGVEEITSELLTINDTESGMLSSNRILFYSTLLNLENYNEAVVGKVIKIAGITVNESNYKSMREAFLGILKKIDTGTIHY